jgi:hypothetical protein
MTKTKAKGKSNHTSLEVYHDSVIKDITSRQLRIAELKNKLDLIQEEIGKRQNGKTCQLHLDQLKLQDELDYLEQGTDELSYYFKVKDILLEYLLTRSPLIEKPTFVLKWKTKWT